MNGWAGWWVSLKYKFDIDFVKKNFCSVVSCADLLLLMHLAKESIIITNQVKPNFNMAVRK